ncbi:MAG: radical SAM protein [Candidatus Korobacteraceae bacterium]
MSDGDFLEHVIADGPAPSGVGNIYDYVLDASKVGWWKDRVQAWERGEKIAPVTMDIAWTRKCNAACSFCFAQMQASEGGTITKELAFKFLDDAAEIGVKGISLISDGESTVVPWYEESIEHAAKVGIKIGIGTNGVRLKRKVLERILPHTSYLRFNFSAGTMQRYKEIMGLQERDYWQVIQNVRDAMEIIRRDNLDCNVNMQMVTMPEFHDEIIPLAKLAQELRPHYLIYKHCADNDEGFLGVDYKKYDALYETFKEVETMGDEDFRVIVKWNRLADEGKRHYSRCLGPPFQLQMSGNGLISSCGFHFNEKFRKFHIGWIAGPEEKRFRDIFKSDRYWDVINYLASEEFDPRERCGIQCLQTHTNQWLFDYVNKKVDFPTTPLPPNSEFL